jgi:hypothetical protein
MQFEIRISQSSARHGLLPVPCCLLPVACSLLPVVCRLVPVAWLP